METKIIDKAICPECGKEFEVTEYGYKKPCPYCGEKLNIFPDSESLIRTPWGTFGIEWGSNRLQLLKTFLKGLF